ncbi:MAG: PD-(D/E)XK nuclease family protein, partial [Acidobacteriota bacterium]
DLAAYERCPRRFFYGRLFGLPGSTRAGAFVKTHRSIYEVLDWLKARPPGPFPANDEALAQLDEAWQRGGPKGHAFEKQYRSLAENLVGNLTETHQGVTLEETEPLEVTLPAGRVVAEPDLAARLPDDRKLLRVIRTGRRGGFRGDDTIYGLFETAARLRYGMDGFELDVLHLTDRKKTPINLSLEKIESRLVKSDSYLEAMAQGQYPAQPDPFTCPRCPYFFVCPTVPTGPLRIEPE